MPNKGPNLKEERDRSLPEAGCRAPASELVLKLSEFRNESKEVETDIAQDLADKAEAPTPRNSSSACPTRSANSCSRSTPPSSGSRKGDFGHCQMCQKEIGKKRLNALPWTPLCIDCQEKAESETT